MKGRIPNVGDFIGITVSILLFAFGVGMIVCSRLSRKFINDACFYSGCFEGDLDGYLDFEELAELSGRTPEQVKKRLRTICPFYMKNYRIVRSPSDSTKEIIERNSKTVTCSCRSCGAPFEKRLYFTGQCPFCKSSDLKAEIVSDDRFYCIYDNSKKSANPAYYEGSGLSAKLNLYAIGLGIALFFTIIALIVFCTMVGNYNNEEYLREFMSSRPYYPFEKIQSDLMYGIFITAFLMVAVGSAVPITGARVSSIQSARHYAKMFANYPYPYVFAVNLPHSEYMTSEKLFSNIGDIIREGYLKGCTPEKYNGQLRFGLARQIVKDRCPGCGASIIGAVHEAYTCRYCKRVIYGVMRKV